MKPVEVAEFCMAVFLLMFVGLVHLGAPPAVFCFGSLAAAALVGLVLILVYPYDERQRDE